LNFPFPLKGTTLFNLPLNFLKPPSVFWCLKSLPKLPKIPLWDFGPPREPFIHTKHGFQEKVLTLSLLNSEAAPPFSIRVVPCGIIPWVSMITYAALFCYPDIVFTTHINLQTPIPHSYKVWCKKKLFLWFKHFLFFTPKAHQWSNFDHSCFGHLLVSKDVHGFFGKFVFITVSEGLSV
jgi:hypothetical protein